MKKTFSRLILYYLRFLARLQIRKLKALNPKLKIIGITGSAGKTSTISALKTILSPSFKVKSTAGSNSESGIPLSLLDVKITGYSPLNWFGYCLQAKINFLLNWQKYDILIIEMGIDAPTSPKNMDYLLSIVKPDIGVFLNVTPVHLENFSSLDQIALEKAKLVNITNLAVIDPSLKKYVTNPNIIYIRPQTIKYHHPLPSIYSHSFGAALAVADALGLDRKTSVNHLQSDFQLPFSRSSIFKGVNQSTLIDSSYNSSPLATFEMLQFLKTFPSPRIAILGDMRELGTGSPGEHQKLYLSATKIAETIISIGPETQKHFGDKAIKFLYWWQALEYLKQHQNVLKNSTVLIKGSQNTIFLEELVKGLLVDKNDSRLLCRQDPYWLEIKKTFHANKNII